MTKRHQILQVATNSAHGKTHNQDMHDESRMDILANISLLLSLLDIFDDLFAAFYYFVSQHLRDLRMSVDEQNSQPGIVTLGGKTIIEGSCQTTKDVLFVRLRAAIEFLFDLVDYRTQH